LTKDELLLDIKEAEKMWEDSGHKNLFEYSTNGDLKINLIYDSRQKATDDLKKIGLVINNDRATFDSLKIKYDTSIAEYNQKKEQLDILFAKYNAAKSAYDKDVERSNQRGGAPKAQFEALEQRRIALNKQVDIINQEKDSLNTLVDSVNSIGSLLNNLINTLNLKIDNYNTVGASNGQQFNEGEYITDSRTSVINIYQFTNKAELVSVLAHEFGHVLGMEHVDNQKAIMYYLNESGNEKLTEDDLGELNRVCKIK
jgi:chromosome segregation ATPase